MKKCGLKGWLTEKWIWSLAAPLATSFCGHTAPLPRALLLVNANVEVYPSNVHLQVILFKLFWIWDNLSSLSRGALYVVQITILGEKIYQTTDSNHEKLVQRHSKLCFFSFWVGVWLKDSGLEVNGESCGIVGSCQVVESSHPGCLRLGLGGQEAGVLLDRQHLALVADCVHRVLVRVRRLEQPSLKYFFGSKSNQR